MHGNKLSQAVLLLAKDIHISMYNTTNSCRLSFTGEMEVDYDEVIKPLLAKIEIGSRTGRIKVKPQEYFCTFCGTKLRSICIRSEDTTWFFGCKNNACDRQPSSLGMVSEEAAIDNYLERYD